MSETARGVVVCLPAGVQLDDPAPEATARRNVQLLDAWADGAAAIVGCSSGGWDALGVARRRPQSLERLVLVSVPKPDEDVPWLDEVQVKSLLLYGSADPAAGSAHGRWWQRRLAKARLEVVPGARGDLLAPMWQRILSFVAPTR